MQLQIVVDYRVPDVEFEELIKVYPLGKYHWGGQSRWFSLEIDGQHGRIELTWFREWE